MVWYWYNDRLAEPALNHVKMGGGIWGRAKGVPWDFLFCFFSFLSFLSSTNPNIFTESFLIDGLCLVSGVGWQEGNPWV